MDIDKYTILKIEGNNVTVKFDFDNGETRTETKCDLILDSPEALTSSIVEYMGRLKQGVEAELSSKPSKDIQALVNKPQTVELPVEEL